MNSSNSNFISVSEIIKNPKKAFDMSSIDFKLVLCNNQPVGYLIGVNNPVAKFLHLPNSTDALLEIDDLPMLKKLFQNLITAKTKLTKKEA